MNGRAVLRTPDANSDAVLAAVAAAHVATDADIAATSAVVTAAHVTTDAAITAAAAAAKMTVLAASPHAAQDITGAGQTYADEYVNATGALLDECQLLYMFSQAGLPDGDYTMRVFVDDGANTYLASDVVHEKKAAHPDYIRKISGKFPLAVGEAVDVFISGPAGAIAVDVTIVTLGK